MSIVLACAFPDAAILMCDSRVSAKGTALRSDTLRKAYQLSPQLVIGFASNDVAVAEKIISVMTDYINNHAKSKNTRYLLEKLPKVASHYYRKFTSSNYRPTIEFIFAGLDSTVSAVVSGKKFLNYSRELLVKEAHQGLFPQGLFGVWKGKKATWCHCHRLQQL